MDNNLTYRKILSLAVPIAFLSLIQSSLSVIDQMMVSGLGAVSMASAGLAQRPLTILFFMFMGLSGALSIFVAQYAGDDRYREIGDVVRIAVKYGVLMLLPMLFISLLVPMQVMRLFSTDMAVMDQGAAYLQIIALSFPLLLASLLMNGILRACGEVKLPMRAGIASVIVNTGLNYVMIYGVVSLGFKGLGLPGAAVATVIARLVELLLLARGAKKIDYLNEMWLKLIQVKRPIEDGLKKRFRKVSAPLLFSELIFVCSITFYALLYGRMGTHEMAAVTLLYPLHNIAFGLFAGMSTAAATLIGQALGGRRYDEARALSNRIMIMTFAMALGLAIVFAGLLPGYLGLYHLMPQVKEQARALILVAMSVLPIQIMNMVIYEGVLRTGGETGYLVKIQLMTLWLIGIPAGITAGFVLELPLPIVFYAVSFEEMVRLVLNLYMMKREVWIANVVD